MGSRRVGPKGEGVGAGGLGARRVVGPKGGGAQNFALFFSRLPLITFFLLSLGVFSWNFGGVFEGRPLKCAFGVLGLPGAPKPPGFHTTVREPKRAHLRVRLDGGGRWKKKRNFGWSGGGRSWLNLFNHYHN